MKMSKWFINSGRVVCALLLLLGAGAWADEAAWKKLSEQTRDRFGVGDDREAERLARYAVAEARQSFGENDARTATSLDTLARILVLSGKPVEAEIQWRNALHIRAAVFGPEARVTGLTYVNIATAMIRSGQITEGEAEAMLGQALRIFEKTDGVNSKNYAAALHSLGAVAPRHAPIRRSRDGVEAGVGDPRKGRRGRLARNEPHLAQPRARRGRTGPGGGRARVSGTRRSDSRYRGRQRAVTLTPWRAS